MDKYEKLFNEYFNDSEFGNDSEKRSLALKSFKKIMDSLKSVKLTDSFIEECVKKLSDELSDNQDEVDPSSNINLLDDLDLLDGEKSIMFPIYENTDEMMRDSGMILEKVGVKKQKGLFIVSETWTSPDGEILLNLKYFLNMDIFSTKDLDIQENIVEKLIDNNHIMSDDDQYLNNLPSDLQKKYYQILLDDSIERELYEKSAIYRDKINSL